MKFETLELDDRFVYQLTLPDGRTYGVAAAKAHGPVAMVLAMQALLVVGERYLDEIGIIRCTVQCEPGSSKAEASAALSRAIESCKSQAAAAEISAVARKLQNN